MELNTEHKCVQKMKRKIRFSRKKEIEGKEKSAPLGRGWYVKINAHSTFTFNF